MKTSTKDKATFVTSIMATLLLFSLALLGSLKIPEFAEIFAGFNTQVPKLTAIYLNGYLYLWLLPAAPLIAWWGYRQLKNRASYFIVILSLQLIAILAALVIFVLGVFAMYSPIYLLGQAS